MGDKQTEIDMAPRSTPPQHGVFPVNLHHPTPAARVFMVLTGTGVLAASAAVAIPIGPVPITLQTYAVLLVGALFGPRLGLATVAAWLVEALIGLPVLAGGHGGPVALFGPTAGYLLGFLPAVAFIGWFARQGWTARLLASFAAMLTAHVAILLAGVLWLSLQFGWARALAVGLMPFLTGSVLKSALVVVTLRLMQVGRPTTY